jgi:hypothetical protein
MSRSRGKNDRAIRSMIDRYRALARQGKTSAAYKKAAAAIRTHVRQTTNQKGQTP